MISKYMVWSTVSSDWEELDEVNYDLTPDYAAVGEYIQVFCSNEGYDSGIFEVMYIQRGYEGHKDACVLFLRIVDGETKATRSTMNIQSEYFGTYGNDISTPYRNDPLI